MESRDLGRSDATRSCYWTLQSYVSRVPGVNATVFRAQLLAEYAGCGTLGLLVLVLKLLRCSLRFIEPMCVEV